MTDAAAAASRDDELGRTLTVGGVLLIASAVLAFVAPQMMSMAPVLRTVVFWGAVVAFSCALVVYAFGLGRGGSIVARKPLGLGAMVGLAAWPLIERIMTLFLQVTSDTTQFFIAWGWISIAVQLAAAIVIVVQIARAGVITGQLRWAPLWGLIAVAAPQIIAQLLVVATGTEISRDENDVVWIFFGLGQLTDFAAPVILGILSIVHAQRRVPRAAEPVQVYPPEA
ncbi:hypothetical protein [Microbacterium sp. SS28]|uniref:hypothetical protein n=1 Tax=Microbacterium sp. SS28 TaxID=2919948 RepID=UPI001FA9F378|nr:hypothetical protein [Microbacterium sp. SS28]